MQRRPVRMGTDDGQPVCDGQRRGRVVQADGDPGDTARFTVVVECDVGSLDEDGESERTQGGDAGPWGGSGCSTPSSAAHHVTMGSGR